MIRAVIFDLGHTLWDIAPGDGSELHRVYQEMRATLVHRLGREDLPEAAVIREAVTAALTADAETYLTTGPVLEQPPTHHWVDAGLQSVGVMIDNALLRDLTPPLFATEIGRLICHDGVVDAVKGLAAAGTAVGCVTNTLADASAIRQMLENHDLLEIMSCVVVSSEEGYRKPHPTLFDKAREQLGVEPEEALFVGDSPYHDIGGAKAAGLRAVLTTQYVTRPWIDGVPEPDARIGHVRELAAVIEKLNAAQRN
jgi:HAD superfamily hydrolase (TIGR01662 family)